MQFTSKAETLKKLSATLKIGKVLPQLQFTVTEYHENKTSILEEICIQFTSNIIVRSSSLSEDRDTQSMAGAFESVLNVNPQNTEELRAAITRVIQSYGKETQPGDQVLIQPMLLNVDRSGVIFTADITTQAPYYIVNYDESGSTDSVTSGSTNGLKTFVSYKFRSLGEAAWQDNLINAANECEEVCANDQLDIEFAFSGKDIYILQVRPLAANKKKTQKLIDLKNPLTKLHSKIEKLNSKHPNLLGDKTVFGVMPDWNPAEIIGRRPKKLALSLYKELVTDETWAYQRDNYGYRNLRSHPLLISFFDIPYIDSRISLNSFIPKELSEQIAEKLVNFYINKLIEHKVFHDKIEFEIVYSCYYFGLEDRLYADLSEVLNKDEINQLKDTLLNLTNGVISSKSGIFYKDLNKVNILQDKYQEIVNSDLSDIDKIYWLVADVKRYGTLPFAGVARAAFISMQFLKSFVSCGIIDNDDYNNFMNTISTVSKKLASDINVLNKNEFLEIYGHLRPGTYDILSPRYDEEYERYFAGSVNETVDTHPGIDEPILQFSFTDTHFNKIDALISYSGLDITSRELVEFIKTAIEGREYLKFVFTKSVSKILKIISNIGYKNGLSNCDLAHLDIKILLDLYSSLDHCDVKDTLLCNIEKNRAVNIYTQTLSLPDLIVNANDIFSFTMGGDEVNFVTQGKILASTIRENEFATKDVSGKIVCIKSADPGYDYLFSRGIVGLVTCYGGANSHMAIRCAEMSIPAVIGCGEAMFTKLAGANKLEIDAGNKKVTCI